MQAIKLPENFANVENSMFKNATSPDTAEAVKLQEILRSIQSDKYKPQIDALRMKLSAGEKDKYDEAKKLLPGLTFSGTFQRRDNRSLSKYIQLFQADFDHVSNMEEVREKLKSIPHIVFIFTSPSGEGLKAAFWVDCHHERHESGFMAMQAHLKEIHGLSIDESCKDISRLCFVSHDPELWTNPDATPFIPPKPKSVVQLPVGYQCSNLKKINGTQYKYGSVRWDEVFDSQGMILKRKENKINVICPWQESHSTGKSGDGSTIIFSNGSGAFKCSHAHCANRGPKDLEDYFSQELVAKHAEPYGNDADKPPNGENWETPQKITAELLPVEELTPEMIPEPLRDWLTDIAHRMQVPLDFSATACVVMLSSIIGTRLSIRPKKNDSWQVIPNLWGALIQRPSQLKSPPVQEVFKVLDKLEAESFKQNEDAEKTYQNENRKFEMKQKIYEDNLRKAMKNGDDLELGSAEKELELLESEPPDKPTTRRYQTQDATPEKLQDLLSENPQGILVFRDELNGFLMSLEKEGHETARAFYLEGWNGGGSFTLDRITRGTVRSNLICISLFGTIQPAKIIPHIRKAKSETGNDGLFQRFQIAVYPDAVKWSYIDKMPNLSAHSRALKLIRRLTEINFREHDSVISEGDGIPYMKFSPEAQDLFESWIKRLETNKLNNLDESPSLLEHFGKYRSLMPSLALIFHLLEIADSNRSGNVSLQAAQQAAQWCEYLETHARRIYGMAEDITARAAGGLSKKIKSGKLEDNFTAREVHRKGWELLTEIETVNAALTDLVEANWLRKITILPTDKGGRKTMKYQINPEIKKSEIL